MADFSNDAQVSELLAKATTIAVVGHSDKPYRTSYQIAQYLRHVGYKVYAVNPTVAEINGEKSYSSVAEIPEEVDIVNVFRRSIYLPEVLSDTLASSAKAIWTQLGVVDDAMAEEAVAAGLDVVIDRCIKVEHMRLAVPWKKTISPSVQ